MTSPSALITPEDIERFRHSYAATDEYRKTVLCAPQRGLVWGKARSEVGEFQAQRATGSNFHLIEEKERWLRLLLWPGLVGDGKTEPTLEQIRNDTPPPHFLDYGTRTEPLTFGISLLGVQARLAAMGYDRLRVEEVGLLIDPDNPFIGVSADAVGYATGPNRRPLTITFEFKSPSGRMAFYGETPPKHYAQFMGTAGVWKADLVVYAVYTPRKTQINYFDPDQHRYWRDDLLPRLTKFFMREYAPLAIAKSRGLLKPGEITLRTIIHAPLIPASLFASRKRDLTAMGMPSLEGLDPEPGTRKRLKPLVQVADKGKKKQQQRKQKVVVGPMLDIDSAVLGYSVIPETRSPQNDDDDSRGGGNDQEESQSLPSVSQARLRKRRLEADNALLAKKTADANKKQRTAKRGGTASQVGNLTGAVAVRTKAGKVRRKDLETM
ncbi:YqaJ-like viral recombinase [Mollivirus sibericum]|uniref:YqaJ-like viral recombinase n=1 Tax=Mollivirus sibericum TaxID=1678078 RepID=UPI0006B2E3C6|nr:YqaJ-like viral recombinase [Mollivirus sibericum]ALD62136.1 YqaJ-like viral recombinase [Mollivirus sibericum]